MDEEEQLQRALAASLGLVYEPEAVRSAWQRAPPVDYCELSEDEDRLIREQQDQEYQESLEIDRAKMATLAEVEPDPEPEPQVEPAEQFVELDWRPFMSSGWRLRLVGSFGTLNVTIQAEAPIEALFSFLYEKLGRHVTCRFENQLLPREGLVSDHLSDRCVVRVE